MRALPALSFSDRPSLRCTPSPICVAPPPTPYSPEADPPTEILPRLWVGDLSSAECAATISSLGITHVVSALPGRVDLPNPHLKQLQLPLHDTPFAELAGYLPAATAFITSALRDANARVLVHCMLGVSRSASVVAAYLIAQYGCTPEQAVQYVQSRRRCAQPNPGFIAQLAEYRQSLPRSRTPVPANSHPQGLGPAHR